jgi:hypothetical protein
MAVIEQEEIPGPWGQADSRVRLMGQVSEEMAKDFLRRLEALPARAGTTVVEMTTLGGDAEMARRMVCEIDRTRKRLAARRLVFHGVTAVYSAGVTIMAAFPLADRFLTADAVLLVHCRQLEKSLDISGPIRASLPKIKALAHEIETGIRLEEENFARLIEGSDVTLDELTERALYNWYLSATEAVDRNLIEAIA